jgi:hypothetical protein
MRRLVFKFSGVVRLFRVRGAVRIWYNSIRMELPCVHRTAAIVGLHGFEHPREMLAR